MKKNINFKKEISKLIILVISLSIFLSSICFGINIDEEKKKKNQMEKDKKAQEQKVKDIQNKLSQNVKEISQCEGEIVKKEEEINSVENEQKKITEECSKQEEDLKEKEKETKEIEKLTKDRLIQIYENGGNDNLVSILASSNGLSEFLSNYQMMKEITRMDSNMLSSLTQKKEKVSSLKKELETKNKLIEKNKQKLVSLKKEQEEIKLQKEDLNASLTEDEKKQKEVLKNYDEKIRKTNALIEAEILRASRSNMAARASGGQNTQTKFVGGKFAWPVPSSHYITAGYGSGYASGYPGFFHTGIDIGAPTGTPAVAANDGVVIYAAFSPYGYGNMVMLDHGGGVYTIYGHGVSIPVSLGQRVRRGQHVLNIGSTGNSTGPHLHFEVRHGARHVNPVPYLY